MPHPIRKKIEAFQWLGFTAEERFKRHLPITQEEYAEKNQISTRQLSNWKAEYDKVQAERQTVGAEKDNGDYDSEAWLLNKTADADKALVKAVQDGNATAIKTFYQLLDRLKEKTEHGVGFELSAGEHIRIAREANRRIQEAGLGTRRSAGLLGEPALLPEEVCVDNQQEHSQDS